MSVEPVALEVASSKPLRPAPSAQLAAALVKVQARLHSVGKDRDVEVRSEKGRYAFRYATLAAIWDVIRQPCADAGIAIVQLPTVDNAKRVVTVETRVLHASGDWLASVVELPLVRTDPQGIGAVISYGRRYGLSAMLGVTQDDENEEQVLADVAPHGPPQSTQRPSPPAPRQPAKPPPAPASTPAPAKKVKDDGTPISADEVEQQMTSCADSKELAKVASRIAGRFIGEERERLLKVYGECKARLGGGK